MQTTIHSTDFSVTEALNIFINRRARKSMTPCAEWVESLTIRLKDINGPKGGQDKECCVEVKVADHPPIVVRKRSTDAYKSVQTALSRAARTTLRKIEKRRNYKDNSPKHSAPAETQLDLNNAMVVPEVGPEVAPDQTRLERNLDTTLDWTH